MVVETRKVYGSRKISADKPSHKRDYGSVQIPPDVLEDPQIPIEIGMDVEIVGVFESTGEVYLKIGGD